MSKKSRSKRAVQQGADKAAADNHVSMNTENKERKQQEQENRSLGGI
ncbi:hypothetical protein ACFQPF_08810 [Fictibacillus iocasae]|uniref:Small EDRK-rich factor-like N-terminal domain-containing protein n=1 Tax=Fictibacillus iocasae TaxID=2715437 RepID=A0ABW2NT17_9BACL